MQLIESWKNMADILTYTIFTLVMLICGYTDLRSRLVYRYITFPAIVFIVIIRCIYHPEGYLFYLLALVPAIVFYLAAVFGFEIGGGDIVILFYMGLSIGFFATMTTILNSFVVSILVFTFAFLKNCKFEYRQPMVTILVIGFVLTIIEYYFLKNSVLQWIGFWG